MSHHQPKTTAEKLGLIIGLIVADITSPLVVMCMVWDAPRKFMAPFREAVLNPALIPSVVLSSSKSMTLTLLSHPLEMIFGGLGLVLLLLILSRLYIHLVTNACAALSQAIATSSITAYEYIMVSLTSAQSEA